MRELIIFYSSDASAVTSTRDFPETFHDCRFSSIAERECFHAKWERRFLHFSPPRRVSFISFHEGLTIYARSLSSWERQSSLQRERKHRYQRHSLSSSTFQRCRVSHLVSREMTRERVMRRENISPRHHEAHEREFHERDCNLFHLPSLGCSWLLYAHIYTISITSIYIYSKQVICRQAAAVRVMLAGMQAGGGRCRGQVVAGRIMGGRHSRQAAVQAGVLQVMAGSSAGRQWACGSGMVQWQAAGRMAGTAGGRQVQAGRKQSGGRQAQQAGSDATPLPPPPPHFWAPSKT